MCRNGFVYFKQSFKDSTKVYHLNIYAVHFFEIEIGNNKQTLKNSIFLGTFVISVNSDCLGKCYAGYKTQMRKNTKLVY